MRDLYRTTCHFWMTCPTRKLKSYTRHTQHLKTLIRRVLGTFEDIAVSAALLFILRPAARLLPRSWALGLANLVAAAMLCLPSPGYITFRHMRSAFGASVRQSLQLSLRWIARPMVDFVILRRIVIGRERLADWTIIQEDEHKIRPLRDSGSSYVVATGHFARPGYLALVQSDVTPARPVDVAAEIPPRGLSPRTLRTRLNYGNFTEALNVCGQQRFDVVHVGENPATARTLYRKLMAPGHVVIVHIDAVWPAGSIGAHTQPFAGFANRTFSNGTTKLAKMADRPIIPCSYAIRNNDTIVVKWGDPVESINDIDSTMTDLLAFLEREIGRQPDQYVLEIGYDRKWQPARDRWQYPA